MTSPDTAELKRLAQAATPGPWAQWAGHGVAWSGGPEALGFMVCECDPNYYAGKDDEGAEAQANATAAYIAAANPQAVMALIERLEKLEAERKGIVKLTMEQARAIEAMPGPASTTMQITCPVCGALRWNHPAEKMRHTPDCWLAAAIKEAERG